ncbi:23S rRNA (pseudouridine(1915)-N(3))-methyltransferase RlmH [Simiduia agarivorans]|uniref:Ribosomal RNA large subunit methyltransferase H n=1 Tax=Simiduia agarivorans (strain DSM 21679 / JCM 13881 / BCRC 17597 / SA1) TaxID=1117647 RepID=K4KKP9_SIMAS|nr:23S rRNA (pseudouridine(1915)-N(3))-methyltransferase RlmH [Simiduia agarivorans]AFU98618.1 ribosomal RNA large subunit methyltransferase H [Simiduia agarivorans SA1 = DSM 21679]
MRIRLIAVGTKMPAWVEQGWQEYVKRLPREISLELVEIPLGTRTKSSSTAAAIAKESDAILQAIGANDKVIALEVKGKDWSTEQLSGQLAQWQMDGDNVSLLVGGPDGLSDACRARAQVHWSLSRLTLPHPLVRVLLAEQVYRAWTILANHPYHK